MTPEEIVKLEEENESVRNEIHELALKKDELEEQLEKYSPPSNTLLNSGKSVYIYESGSVTYSPIIPLKSR